MSATHRWTHVVNCLPSSRNAQVSRDPRATELAEIRLAHVVGETGIGRLGDPMLVFLAAARILELSPSDLSSNARRPAHELLVVERRDTFS